MELDKKNIKKILGIITFTLLLFAVLQNISKVWLFIGVLLGFAFPFIFGGSVAFIINVPMRFIENKLFQPNNKIYKFKRPISLVITLVLVIGVLFIVSFLIVPELGRTIKSVMDSVPLAVERMQVWLLNLEIPWPAIQNEIANLEIKWDEIGKQIIEFLQKGAGTIFNSTYGVVTSIVSGVTNFFIGMIFAIYVLFQKEKLTRQVKQLFYSFFPLKAADRIINIAKLSSQTFSNFLTGQCTEAIILGTMFFVTMTLFGFPYALLVGVLISVASLIPIVGAFIGCAVGAILILTVNPMQALWFLVLFLVLQQIEGNLIYPHVVGNSVGLPSMWVLAAVTLGGSAMGVFGMLISIPVFSIIYSIMRENVYKRLSKRHIPDSKWKESDTK